MSEASTPAPAARASIYDLGYRSYDGVRLGRQYAALSLFAYSFRAIFGLGRSAWAKVFPIGLAIVASVPAFVLLGVAAIAPDQFEFAKPEEYFGFISIVLGLFCAVAAPELIGRDQRHHTLALYFSRALSRVDYLGAKLAAIALALLIVTVTPQILLLTGNAVATTSLTNYLKDNADLLLPVVGSSMLVAAFMGSVSLAIAVQTSRRAFATGAVIATFVILTAIGGILADTLTGSLRHYSLLISPFGLLEGAVYYIFNAPPKFDSNLDHAGLNGVWYVVAALVYTAIAVGVLYRKMQRLAV
ncbi:MAG TPA: ABC transporter permease subunit [Dehalococcoidia bacterium]|nr:ABC transporter permease subunit [Dehalococcoidia bacterium]